MFALLGQFHFEILKDPLRRKTAGIGSKTEFVLPVNDAGSPSGDDEWLDAGCNEGEQAEDFCDHGAGMLAGLVGHPRGEEIFLKKPPREERGLAPKGGRAYRDHPAWSHSLRQKSKNSMSNGQNPEILKFDHS